MAQVKAARMQQAGLQESRPQLRPGALTTPPACILFHLLPLCRESPLPLTVL